MVRTNQGGSILGFVIIGGVLALLLVGGVYFVRQQLTTPPSDTETSPQPQPEATPENNEGQGEQSPAPQPETTMPGQQEEQSEAQEALPGGGAGELPQTGPTETFAAVMIFFVLTATVTGYLRSRRQLRSL